MTDKKLQEFKTLLIAERKMIVDKILDQEEDEKSLCQASDDGFDEQSNDPAVELLEKLTKNEAKLVRKIDLALTKTENKSYGICTSCNGEIPLKRLEAKPSVSLCLECQTKHESNI